MDNQTTHVCVPPIHVKCRTDTAVQGMILCWLCEFGACFCSCAQSGNGRHSSHQRKINQQEESCQNLTDFTPARVPSKVDIFTAYNDSLQCSHECVRAGIPVYTDEMIQHTPIYKTSYNGNRQEPKFNRPARGGCFCLNLCLGLLYIYIFVRHFYLK